MVKKILKKTLNPIRLLIGVTLFVIFKKNTNFAYQGMVNAFCDTKGKSNQWMHRCVQWFKKPYLLPNEIDGVLGALDKEKVKKIAKEIDEKGYYVFEQGLSSSTVDKLLQFALETKARVRPTENFYNSVDAVRELEMQTINRESPVSIRYDFKTQDLLDNEEVQKLLADVSIMAVAQAYLQCQPKSDVLGMWWHTAFSKEENAESATMYHFDMDRIKWLKFFFYLTDTRKDTGAHQFIEGSHNGNIPKKFLQQGYARLNTKEVLDHYGEDKEITYEAPAGTIIAEDTSGLHRGNPVQRDDRLVFQIQFSNSLFGAESHTGKLNMNKIHQNLKVSVENYPDMYELYLTDTFQYKG